jgi:uncharacterized protein (DUF427 family)
VIENNHYFPAESLHKKFFRASDTHTTCPWKGIASYYSIVVDGDQSRCRLDASEAAQAITGRVAFWKGVEVIE